MPFEPHDLIARPDREATTWRYMDIAKYATMLKDASLFFASAATLQHDPWESIPTKPAADWIRTLRDLDGESAEWALHEARQTMRVNCWHLNEGESAAMWKLYGTSGGSIAIRTSVGALIDSLQASPLRVFVGAVQYVDHYQDNPEPGLAIMPAFLKRKAFEHECELRAAIWARINREHGEMFDGPGARVEVDLSVLVTDVFTSPAAPDWFHDVVVDVTAKYGLQSPVTRSRLGDGPSYF